MAAEPVISVIGCGNLGGALVEGLAAGKLTSPGKLRVFDSHPEKTAELARRLGIHAATSLAAAVDGSEIAVVAVKPKGVAKVLEQIRSDAAHKPRIIVSVAAGVTISAMRAAIGEGPALARVMPNTPAVIGKGMSAVYTERPEDRAQVRELFSPLGKTAVLEYEALVDCAAGLCGSGPAFVFTVIEALADGAVKVGLPRDTALEMAAQVVLGSAAMVLERNLHPAVLRDMVTSPGGITASGLHVLEQAAVRAAFAGAVEAAALKSRQLMSKE